MRVTGWNTTPVSVRTSTYHPHHDIGEDAYPQGGAKEGNQEVLLPAWLADIWEREEEEEDNWPGQQPPDRLRGGS